VRNPWHYEKYIPFIRPPSEELGKVQNGQNELHPYTHSKIALTSNSRSDKTVEVILPSSAAKEPSS